jgi:transcriptional regulator with GAF, ATPase, and Fis domain
MIELQTVSETKLEPQSEDQTSALPLRTKKWTLRSDSPAWSAQLEKLASVARTEFPILLLGPSGSGKDVLAHHTHDFSYRRHAPLMSVNCSTLTETLIESELFGHIKGSFTGAVCDRKGAFETARGGTLFLDEIGDLPNSMQAKLLRALENNEIRPVGSDKTITTDVRIIAATHQDLYQKIRTGHFRADLFYRLNVINITVPPLKDRIEDFDTLLAHFCKQYKVRFSAEALYRLKIYEWPGNIRELKNVVARASALFSGQTVADFMLIPLLDVRPTRQIGPRTKAATIENYVFDKEAVRSMEKHLILSKLRQYQGNQRQVAKALGLPKSTLWDRCRAYGIECSRFKSSIVENYVGTQLQQQS